MLLRSASLLMSLIALSPGSAAGAADAAERADLTALLEERGRVVRAADGWLLDRHGLFYLQRAIEPAQGAEPAELASVAAMRSFAAELAERDIALVVAIAPPRAIATAPQWATEADAEALARTWDRRRQRILRAVSEDAFLVVDLSTQLDGDIWPRASRWWNGAGARTAAEQVAAEILAEQYFTGPLTASWQETPTEGTWQADLDQTRQETGRWWRVGRDGERTETGQTPILLLGGPLLQAHHAGGRYHARSAGFPDHLQRALSTDALIVAGDRAGPPNARMQLLRQVRADKGALLDGVQLLIWLIPGEDLLRDDAWRIIKVVDCGC